LEAERIVDEVARSCSPSDRRRKEVAAAVRKVMSMLERASRGSEVRPKIELGGSYAHDTWLEEQTDVDFFLVYPKEVERKSFEEMGLALAERALKECSPRRRYAEHPYVEADIGTVTINAVPCYGVDKGEWKSAADRSPFHTLYMRDRLDGALKSQVRTLKVFLKAQGLYGAEIRVRGFSGYACEVLTLRYGSFLGLLRAASSWGKGDVVSLEGGEETARALFMDDAFILLDPVDVTRNLGRAVAPEKLAEFIFLSRLFLKRPKAEFFSQRQLRPPPSPPRYVKEHTLLLTFRYREKSEDILWGELWKSANGISAHLEKDGAHIVRSSVAAENGRAAIAFIIESGSMPGARTRSGPEVFMGDATEKFFAASKGRADSWWLGGDMRSHALFEGEFPTPKLLLGSYMKDPVTSVGFARGLASEAAGSHAVLAGASAYGSRRPADRQALAGLAGYRF